MRSSKVLGLGEAEGSIYILNMMDGTEQELLPNQLYTESNIGAAYANAANQKAHAGCEQQCSNAGAGEGQSNGQE